MARSKSRSYSVRSQSHKIYSDARRDAFRIANPRLPRSPSLRLFSPLIEIEDRRTFHPERDFRPARSFDAPRHRLVVRAATPRNPDRFSSLRAFPSPHVSFHAPHKVLICVRRARRREVLHALRKTGRGRGRQRTPRRNWLSDVTCS